MIADELRAAFHLFLIVQPFVSAAIGLAVVVYIVHRLLAHGSDYNRAERAGMALVASGIVMATPALWIVGTPFDGWTFNLGRLGVAMFVISGGLRRDRHRERNMATVAWWQGFNEGKARGRAEGGRL